MRNRWTKAKVQPAVATLQPGVPFHIANNVTQYQLPRSCKIPVMSTFLCFPLFWDCCISGQHFEASKKKEKKEVRHAAQDCYSQQCGNVVSPQLTELVWHLHLNVRRGQETCAKSGQLWAFSHKVLFSALARIHSDTPHTEVRTHHFRLMTSSLSLGLGQWRFPPQYL